MITGELDRDVGSTESAQDPAGSGRLQPLRLIRVALLALALGATGFSAPRADATTMASLTIEQITDASTYVVEGTITQVWTELDPKSGMVWTVAKVSVTDTHKGPDSPTELVISSAGGEYGDYSVFIPSMAVFSAQ
jgi:hypothetical protein